MGVLATPSHALRCKFDTNFGPVFMDWNQQTGAVQGHYPHQNGNFNGYRDANGVVRGDWRQQGNNRSGQYEWRMDNHGFRGSWKYTQDPNWRGEWNGKFRGCQ